MSKLRAVAAMAIKDAQFAQIPNSAPVLEWIDLKDLMIDEDYQRKLTRRSRTMIRHIAENWSWKKFKAPNVEKVGSMYHIIDGQHTTIAAATRGDIPKIPCLVTETSTLENRASSFIGINVDRVGITKIQLHIAKLAANDEDAIKLQEMLNETGVNLIGQPKGFYDLGDTFALSTLEKLAKTRTSVQFKMILEVCISAKLAPISAYALKAIDGILWGKAKTALPWSTFGLVTTLRSKSQPDWHILVQTLSSEQNISEHAAFTRGLVDEYRRAIEQTTANGVVPA